MHSICCLCACLCSSYLQSSHITLIHHPIGCGQRLDEFKKLNPPVDLIEGAEMEMTIRGDTLLYKNSAGGVGAINSAVFCKAMCDVFYGAETVSPTQKEEVVKGIQAL